MDKAPVNSSEVHSTPCQRYAHMKTLLSRYFDAFNLKYNDDEIENLSHELTNYGHFLASESPVDYIHFNPREEFIHYTASNYPKEHHYL